VRAAVVAEERRRINTICRIVPIRIEPDRLGSAFLPAGTPTFGGLFGAGKIPPGLAAAFCDPKPTCAMFGGKRSD
jgi:hypothetical protein